MGLPTSDATAPTPAADAKTDGPQTLIGGNDADTLAGGSGNDVIDGNRGNDLLLGGRGDDTFHWNPGDGSDTVDGGVGIDTMAFNGANIAEKFDLSASGGHLSLHRDVANITMDIDNTERVQLRTLGGADLVNIGDLSSTDVNRIDIDLGTADGSGDGAADVVQLNGRASGDLYQLGVSDGATFVNTTRNGVPSPILSDPLLFVSHAEDADRLVIAAGGGADTLDASALGGGATVNFDGGDGGDVVAVNGGSGADAITFFGSGASTEGVPLVFTVNNGPVARVNLQNVETVSVDAGAGNDAVAIQNSSMPASYNVDGGIGNDTLTGGNGNDTLSGGDGNDFLDGNIGGDLLLGGAGNDTIQWDPGDGSDRVDGGAGADVMQFNGSNAGEKIDLFAQAGHLILHRDVANITMDIDNVETVNVRALGSADRLTIGDLSGTDVKQVNVDLGGFDGNPDATADVVAVNGGDGADKFVLTAINGALNVGGLSVGLNISHGEQIDRLAITAGGGADTLDASALPGAGITANFDGGDGADVVLINDGSGSDSLVFAQGTADPAEGTPLAFTINNGPLGQVNLLNVEMVSVNAGAGDDRVTIQNFASPANFAVDGGTGNDSLAGGNGSDTLSGGDGADLIDGNIGADLLLGGAGNDTIQWDPGDGSDTVDGGSGADTMQFNGSNAGEKIDLSASAGHLILHRDVANITMDIDNVETVNIRALGSADRITLGDLGATDVKQVNVDLGAFDGAPDAAADVVAVNGTEGGDKFVLTAANGGLSVGGLSVGLSISHGEQIDRLAIAAGGGADTLDASALPGGGITASFDGGDGADVVLINDGSASDTLVFAQGSANPGEGTPVAFTVNNGPVGQVNLLNVETVSVNAGGGDDHVVIQNFSAPANFAVDGGSGNDSLAGGNGSDTLSGGDGADLIDGNIGADLLLGGSGDDTIQWDPGDGSDTVDGGSGADTMQFNGSNAGEKIDLSASAGHLILHRDVANITMDIDNTETVNVRALGSADQITIGDLSGTDVKQVNVDLGDFASAPDATTDIVTATGRASADHIVVSGSAGSASVTGLPGGVSVSHADFFDQLVVAGGGGADQIDATGFTGDLTLTLQGQEGNDSLKDGSANDSLSGGAGDDTISTGGGFDTISGGVGNDRFFADSGQPRDIIVDFQAHGTGADADVLVLSGFSDHSFAAAVANGHIVQSGADVLVGDASGTAVLLQNVLLTSLHANDFIFG